MNAVITGTWKNNIKESIYTIVPLLSKIILYELE